MTDLKTVKRKAAKLGAVIDYDPAIGCLSIEAPGKTVFKANGCHCLAYHTERGQPFDFEDAADSLDWGIEPCTNEECDICNEIGSNEA